LGVAAMLFTNARQIETTLVKAAPVVAVQKFSSSAQSSSVQSAKPVMVPMTAKTFMVGERNNPFSGLTFYYVGDLQDGMLFEVVYPDKSVLTFKQRDLKALGFTVLKVNQSVAQVIFDGQISFAFTKPRRPSMQAVQANNDVAMVSK
jgi:hypothetical protein